jgi:hypothetical protein
VDFLYAVGMWAKFPIYDHMIQTPEASRMWANFSIYEGLTKTPENATEYV